MSALGQDWPCFWHEAKEPQGERRCFECCHEFAVDPGGTYCPLCIHDW